MGVFRRQRPPHRPNRRHLDRLHAMEKSGDPQRRGKTREDFVIVKKRSGRKVDYGGRALITMDIKHLHIGYHTTVIYGM